MIDNELKLIEVKELINKYGENKTLKQLADEFDMPFVCPNCSGSGYYSKKIGVPYPSGLPDSGWVPPDVRYEKTSCDLCNGNGYTKEEYKPKMVQNGWTV